MIFQNETKLNSSREPVIRKMLRDGLSCRSMNAIDMDFWSESKSMIHANIFPACTCLFITAGKICFTRALLGIGWRFFGKIEDETFAEGCEDCDVILSDREKWF